MNQNVNSGACFIASTRPTPTTSTWSHTTRVHRWREVSCRGNGEQNNPVYPTGDRQHFFLRTQHAPYQMTARSCWVAALQLQGSQPPPSQLANVSCRRPAALRRRHDAMHAPMVEWHGPSGKGTVWAPHGSTSSPHGHSATRSHPTSYGVRVARVQCAAVMSMLRCFAGSWPCMPVDISGFFSSCFL